MWCTNSTYVRITETLMVTEVTVHFSVTFSNVKTFLPHGKSYNFISFSERQLCYNKVPKGSILGLFPVFCFLLVEDAEALKAKQIAKIT